MIKLPQSLVMKINHLLGTNKDNFTQEDFNKIESLIIYKNEITYLDLFPNIKEIEINFISSIDNDDLKIISYKTKNIQKLIIKGQSNLTEIDINLFPSIKELTICNNENLTTLNNIGLLKKLTLYNNRELDSKQIVDFVFENRDCLYTLDIIYLADILRYSYEKNIDYDINCIKWIEADGLRSHKDYEFSRKEIHELLLNISYVTSKYIYNFDGDFEKFGVLYRWMINNVSFVNEDGSSNNINYDNIYKVFNFRHGGRLTYARAFQILLSFVGIKSYIVYSIGALDNIGYYNGNKVCSLVGNSDYAILRIILDDRCYYADIAWDAMISKLPYFNKMKLFLISREELVIRHNIVGENKNTLSYSYHGDDCDDLLMYSLDRINDADKVFKDIEQFDASIKAEEFNYNYLNKKYLSKKGEILKIDKDSLNYRVLSNEIVSISNDMSKVTQEINKYKEYRRDIIFKNSNYLLTNYLDRDILQMSKDKMLDIISKKYKKYFISKYMYDVLIECLNIKEK